MLVVWRHSWGRHLPHGGGHRSCASRTGHAGGNSDRADAMLQVSRVGLTCAAAIVLACLP